MYIACADVLAPFYCVSRGHGMEIVPRPHQSLVFRIRVAIISEPIQCISFKFSYRLPSTLGRVNIGTCEENAFSDLFIYLFYYIFRFSYFLVLPWEPTFHCFILKSLLKVLLNSLLNDPYNSTLLAFLKLLSITFFRICFCFRSLTSDPMGAKIQNSISSSNRFWITPTSPGFSSQWSSRKYCFQFLKFWISVFKDYFPYISY